MPGNQKHAIILKRSVFRCHRTILGAQRTGKAVPYKIAHFEQGNNSMKVHF